MKETLTLNSQEQQRIKILNLLLGGDLSNDQAASLLQYSDRHVYRLKASYREKVAATIIHGNRGQVSHRRIRNEVRDQVVTLACGVYAGCNRTTGCHSENWFSVIFRAKHIAWRKVIHTHRL